MFALGIRYLNGWAMATHPSDRERAEWPPHPDRVFMALAAAYFETDGAAEERTALEWLERLEPPELAVSKAEERTVIPTYAPVNDTEIARPDKDSADKQAKRLVRLLAVGNMKDAKEAGLAVLPEFRSRQKVPFPVVIPHDPNVYLIWQLKTCPEEHRAAVASLCEKVTSIGDPSSLAQMWMESTPPASTLVPDEHSIRSTQSLRVFGRGNESGRLARLKAHHELEMGLGRRQRIPCDAIRYRPAETSHAEPCDLPHSVFDSNFLLFQRMEGPRLGLESTLQLTEALRNAVMSHYPVQPPPAWISGHKPDGSPAQGPHLAFIPLPDVGHEHAGGHLLGVAIAVPGTKYVSEAEQKRCLGPLLFDTDTGEVRTIELRTKGGVWSASQGDEDKDTPIALQSKTWAAPRAGSTLWATVTPIVFDRHPKEPWSAANPPRVRAEKQAAYWAEVESMIAQACENIGLPRPSEVTAAAASAFRGAPSAGRMPRMFRKDGTQKRQTHAVIRFEKPVVGPVLLGAGRYRGYGLCRPLPKGGEA